VTGWLILAVATILPPVVVLEWLAADFEREKEERDERERRAVVAGDCDRGSSF
jgi:hypothetical protein